MQNTTSTTRTRTTLIADRPELDMYLLNHRSMITSSAALAQAVAELAADPSPDGRRTKALRRWYHGFADEIVVHHHIEDVMMFPALAERVPTYDELGPTITTDHAVLDVVLDGLREALDQADLARAVPLANELRDHLDEHLGFENSEIVPLFARHFTRAEIEDINERAVKLTPPKQMLFTCPWIMSLLDEQEQAELLGSVPKALTVLWWLTRRRYRRLVATALGTADPSFR